MPNEMGISITIRDGLNTVVNGVLMPPPGSDVVAMALFDPETPPEVRDFYVEQGFNLDPQAYVPRVLTAGQMENFRNTAAD